MIELKNPSHLPVQEFHRHFILVNVGGFFVSPGLQIKISPNNHTHNFSTPPWDPLRCSLCSTRSWYSFESL